MTLFIPEQSMKKNIISFVFFTFLFFTAASESAQTVLPNIVYTGDSVEIRYTFTSETAFFPARNGGSPTEQMRLSTDYPPFAQPEFSGQVSIQSIFLEKNGAQYTLALTVIPWKPGLLSIPPIDVAALVRYTQNAPEENAPFLIHLEPIEVRSLAEKNGISDFLPPAPPLVLPGTTVFLVLAASGSILIFAVLVFVLVRIPLIASFVRRIANAILLKKNARIALGKLGKLLKSSATIPDDAEYARTIQHILREFLTKRFAHDFRPIPTGSIYSEFETLCGGNLTEKQNSTVETLIAILIRTDYIRFAHEQFLAAEYGEEGKTERAELVGAAIGLIGDFDDDSV